MTRFAATLKRAAITVRRFASTTAGRKAIVESSGICCVLVGLWWIHPATAMIAGGLVVLVPSVWSTLQGGRR